MTFKMRGLVSAATVALAAGMAYGAQAQETTAAWKGAPQWTNDDVQFKVRGRILVDAVFESVDRETGVDYDARAFRGRQAFLGVEGKLNNSLAYKLEGGFVNGGTPVWDDVVLEYKPNDMTSILVGNIKATGLENLTSTRFVTFMERGAYGDIGVDSYLLSVVAKFNGPNWTVTGAVQGDSINSVDLASPATGTDVEERLGFTGRASFAPILTDPTKAHIAASARYRDHGNESAFAYQIRPNTSYGSRFVNTGAIGDADTTWALEGLLIHNSLSLQAEYANIGVDRLAGATSSGADPDLQVGYVFASWWPTGEMRNYDPAKGEIGRPRILNPITAGGWGGVEVGLRYEFADLTEAYDTADTPAALQAAQDAGEFSSWTLGVNYYPTSYVRLQANYTAAKNDNPVLGRDVDVDVLQFRAQVDF